MGRGTQSKEGGDPSGAALLAAFDKLGLRDIPASWVDAQFEENFCTPATSPWGVWFMQPPYKNRA